MKSVLHKIKSDQIFSHLISYLSGDIIVKGLAFITIPIFTRILSTDEYGVFSLFNTSIQITITILGLGISAGISRYYFEENKDFWASLGSNLIFINIYMLIAVIATIFFFYRFIPLQFNLIIFLLIASCCGVFFDIYQKYLMSSKESNTYRKILIDNNLIFYGLGIVLLFIFQENKYYGLIYSKTLAFLLVGSYSLYKLIKLSKYSFNKQHIIYTLNYSIPLLPAILSNFILAQFDRYAIQNLTNSMSNVGIYSFAYNVGMILNTFIVAIANSWRPFFYEKMNKNDYSGLESIVYKNTKLVFVAALLFLLFSKEIVMVMADEKYFEALNLVPVIILSYVFIYFYTIYFQYLSYNKKTIFISINACIAGATNIILNYKFIPIYGYMAAAYTTLVSYILLFLLHYMTSYLINKGKIIKFKNIFKNLIYLLLMFAIYYFIEIYMSNYIVLLCIKVLIILISTLYYFKIEGVSR